ncbi:hypothetical protein BDR07DRAFT_1482608 [Suillus spraguei]|nr:hypothetical protein BDR07DRAFT_1482608 [Suillus spraguei]
MNPNQILGILLFLSSSAYAQSSDQYSYWGGGRVTGVVIGAQPYGPPPGPPPGHSSNIASMNPYEFHEHPESRPPPPPYMKGGEGVSMPQETNYSSPPGPPPVAHTRENNNFV